MFYGRPVPLDCPDVRPLPDVRRSTIEAFLRISRTLRTSDTFTTEAFLRTSGPSGRPCSGCPAQLGRPYPVHWIVAHILTAVGRPMTVGCPDLFVPSDVRCSPDVRPILYPKRSLVLTTYIYTSPFHGIRLTIHFEPIKNTPHSLSHSSTPNPRFPSVLGAFARSSPIK